MFIIETRAVSVLGALAVAFACVLLGGCATSPRGDAAGRLDDHRLAGQACRAGEVRYCVASGERGEDGLCTCKSQGAALESVRSLDAFD